MGEFYLMTRKRLRRQVVEFVDVRGFDDPQGRIRPEMPEFDVSGVDFVAASALQLNKDKQISICDHATAMCS
jgi:hypothetical protein